MNTQVVRHSSVGIEPEEWERHRIQHNSELLVPSFSNPEDPEVVKLGGLGALSGCPCLELELHVLNPITLVIV